MSCVEYLVCLYLLGVEITTLSPEDLDQLAKKARVVINTIGPYCLYSTPVVEACARNGTHYLDVTGESPWVHEMIQKYHSVARANRAIIIPEIGIESAPSDMLAWSLATLLRRRFDLDTAEVICTLHQVKSRPSGGTLATILGILDAYSLKEVSAATRPWAMSPIPRPLSRNPDPLFTRLFGIRQVPSLGTLTTSIAGPTNRAIVQRSWGLLNEGKYYGPKFQYSEYLSVRNTLVGILVHFAFAFGALALVFRPLRWLVKQFVYAPGEGLAKIHASKEIWEFRAIATANENTHSPKRAFARFRWDGGTYYLTGIFLAQAAMVILEDSSVGDEHGGGVLTPAVLGQLFIQKLQKAGVVFETGIMPPH